MEKRWDKSRNKKGEGDYLIIYDNPSDLIANMKAPANSYRLADASDRADFKDWGGTGNWYQTQSVEDAIEIYQSDRWLPKDAEKIASNVEHLFNKFIMSPEYTYLDEPGILDVGEYLTGSPDYWLGESEDFKPNTGVTGKSITFVVNLSVSCAVNGDAIIKGGTMMFSLIEILNAKNVPTQLILVNGLTNSYYDSGNADWCLSILTVKSFSDSLNSAKAAFSVAHPSSFRRFGFRTFENMGQGLGKEETKRIQEKFHINASYGYPISNLTADNMTGYIGVKPDLLLNAQTDFDFGNKSPEAWIEGQLKEFGVI